MLFSYSASIWLVCWFHWKVKTSDSILIAVENGLSYKPVTSRMTFQIAVHAAHINKIQLKRRERMDNQSHIHQDDLASICTFKKHLDFLSTTPPPFFPFFLHDDFTTSSTTTLYLF